MGKKQVLHHVASYFNPGFCAIAATLSLSLASARAEIVVETTIDEGKILRYFQQGSPGTPPFGFPTPGFRYDYVVGNGTNGVRPGPFVANLASDSTFTFVVKAPLARTIVIAPPSSSWSGITLDNNISFLASGAPGASAAVTPTITFENLVGPAPTVSVNSSTVSTPDGLLISFNVSASTISSEIAFTAVRYSFTYSDMIPGSRTYSYNNGNVVARSSTFGGASNPGPLVKFRNLPSVPTVHSDIALYAGLSFPTTSNRTYVVQYVSDVNSTNWTTIANVLATSTNTVFFDPQSSTQTKRFYQVLEP